MMFFGMIFWVVLFIVGLVALRGFQASPPTYPPTPRRDASPEEILKARYARGEITREEFEQMWRDLHQE